MPIVIKELVIRGIVAQPATNAEPNSPREAEKRANRAQMTVNMVEEIVKSKKER
ncbi:DUF5908 family protein [Wandonia haliotis]|uniref:DUF5908 family protein n=1 Tax=Wandonia haliotis TaxID=574963 RepID=UPI0031D227FC